MGRRGRKKKRGNRQNKQQQGAVYVENAQRKSKSQRKRDRKQKVQQIIDEQMKLPSGNTSPQTMEDYVVQKAANTAQSNRKKLKKANQNKEISPIVPVALMDEKATCVTRDQVVPV